MPAILAAFDHRQIAARAMHRLAAAGFRPDQMLCEHELEHLRRRDPQPAGSTSVLASYGRLFADLVQTNVDPRHGELISQAVQRGACVLAVDATAGQVEVATALLRECGAFNVSVQDSVATGSAA